MLVNGCSACCANATPKERELPYEIQRIILIKHDNAQRHVAKDTISMFEIE